MQTAASRWEGPELARTFWHEPNFFNGEMTQPILSVLEKMADRWVTVINGGSNYSLMSPLSEKDYSAHMAVSLRNSQDYTQRLWWWFNHETAFLAWASIHVGYQLHWLGDLRAVRLTAGQQLPQGLPGTNEADFTLAWILCPPPQRTEGGRYIEQCTGEGLYVESEEGMPHSVPLRGSSRVLFARQAHRLGPIQSGQVIALVRTLTG